MAQDKPERTTFGRSPEARAKQRLHTDQRITDAVLELVRTIGPDAVTMEAVSAASGVAKTTLYRRYHDRHDLLRGIALQIATLDQPVVGLTQPDLTALLKALQDTFVSTMGYGSSTQLPSSGSDLTTTWRTMVVKPRVDALHDFFVHGADEGALRTDFDYRTLVECLVGGIIMCATMRGEVPDDWADQAVRVVWPVIAATGART